MGIGCRKLEVRKQRAEVGCRKFEGEERISAWRCKNLRGDIGMSKTKENIEKMKRESLAAVYIQVV